ncbi:MAG: trypsin-like peptidase domain-containing protein, partial [Oscillospiraceae bacterium]
GVTVMLVLCMVLSPILGVFGGFVGFDLAQKNSPNSGNNTGNKSVNISSIKPTEGLTLSALSSLVAPSVVEITTESHIGNQFISQYVESGAGSGVVLTEDGYIVTNNHVIANASTVKVRLSNGDEYDAEFIGTDEQTDLAVIKIDAKGLTPAQLGDSSSLAVGQDIIAVGNPLGELGGTVTNGIISALDRDVTVEGQTMRLLQTNAAISPGNSGGGLFAANGELIGIVNAKSGGTNVEGLGFAIPVNTVKRVTGDLIENGYVGGRISTGMTLIEINDEMTAMRYGIKDFGVYVYSVENNSSAQVAGLASGDLIKKVNDEEIEKTGDVKAAFEDEGVGKTVTLTIVRDDEEKELQVLLTELVPDNVRN